MRTRKITKEEIDAILLLRRKGWTYQSLAYIYGVDHSSIYHWCQKYHIEKGLPEVVFNLPKIIEDTQPMDPIPSILQLIVRHKPESYAEYRLQLR